MVYHGIWSYASLLEYTIRRARRMGAEIEAALRSKAKGARKKRAKDGKTVREGMCLLARLAGRQKDGCNIREPT